MSLSQGAGRMMETRRSMKEPSRDAMGVWVTFDARAADGDERARLALDMFIYRIRHYMGAYFFALGKVDALVFTAGIGEHDPITREKCCEGLEHFGVFLDLEKNQTGRGQARETSKPDSPVKIFVIPTNEELEIARQTVEVLKK